MTLRCHVCRLEKPEAYFAKTAAGPLCGPCISSSPLLNKQALKRAGIALHFIVEEKKGAA